MRGKIIAGMAAVGLFAAGAVSTLVLTATATVVLDTPISDSKDHTDIITTEICLNRFSANGLVDVRFSGNNAGTPIPGTESEINVKFPDHASGAAGPDLEFSVTGYFTSPNGAGRTPTCNLARSALNTRFVSIFNDADTFAANCVN